MSEVNIDAILVRDGGENQSCTDEKLAEMTNDCICCTLRDGHLNEVRRLSQDGVVADLENACQTAAIRKRFWTAKARRV